MKLAEESEAPLPPVTAWRAECNRLVLEANVKAYDRRRGRTSRRQSARSRETTPPQQEASAAA